MEKPTMLPPSSPRTVRAKSKAAARPSRIRLQVETLEDRCLMAAGLSASLVADITPGAASSSPYNLTTVNSTLYFGASDPTNGSGLWKSDGTAAGTVLVKQGLVPSKITALNGSAIVVSSGQLWVSDGTPAGTVSVGKTWQTRFQTQLAVVGGKAFFTNFDTDHWDLLTTDGTVGGTTKVKSFPVPYSLIGIRDTHVPNLPGPTWLTDLNGTLYFAAYDSTHGTELWRSDGTGGGTTLVKDITRGSDSSYPQYLTVVNGALYFGAAGGLWKSDGTAAGTKLVKSIMTSGGSPSLLTNVNGTLYFEATDGASGLPALWKSDGTAAGTVVVKDVNPANLTNVNGTLFFTTDDGTHGVELWKSNGTAAGTGLVLDIAPGSTGSNPTYLTNVNGLLYFAADDGVHGNELWQSDGTAAGTLLVQDINPGSAASDPAYLTAMNNKLYFAATDPVHGRELWDPPAVAGPPATTAPAARGDQLIGNGEDSWINAFDPETGRFPGTLQRLDGRPVVIPGLWDLAFASGAEKSGELDELFFMAGPNIDSFAESGLFGVIAAPGKRSTARASTSPTGTAAT
jgi:ELWxxDGT repeat protein